MPSFQYVDRDSLLDISLAYCLAENKVAFIDSGGVGFLMESVLVGTMNAGEKLKETAAMLLRCICNAGQRSGFFFEVLSHLLDNRDSLLAATDQQLLPNILDLIEFHKEDASHRVLQQHLVWAVINLTRNRDDLKGQFGKLSMFCIMPSFLLLVLFSFNCCIYSISCPNVSGYHLFIIRWISKYHCGDESIRAI